MSDEYKRVFDENFGEEAGKIVSGEIGRLKRHSVPRNEMRSELRQQALIYWGVSAVIFAIIVGVALYIADGKSCDCNIKIEGYDTTVVKPQ